MAGRLTSRSKSAKETHKVRVIEPVPEGEPCNPCRRDKIEDNATCWCIDCAEALCADCHNHHRKSKISSKHKTIPISSPDDISEFMRNFTQACCDHCGGSFTFFCRNHNILCCPSCVTKHQKECNEIITLDDASVDAKKNGVIEDLGARMKDALVTLNEIDIHKKENVAMLNAQKDGIKATLTELRRKIGEYFDSLEKRVDEKLAQAHGECIEKLESQTKDLEGRINVLKTWQNDITLIKDFGSDVHAFVMSKNLENLMSSLETFNKMSTENFIGLNITFVTSTTAENLQRTVQTLGEVSVNRSSTELIITPRKSNYGRLKSKLVDK